MPSSSDTKLLTFGRPAPGTTDEDEGGADVGYRIRRLRDAALRVKWVAAVLVILGVFGGFGATKFVKPTYDVETKLYLGAQRGDGQRQGPIQEGQFVAREGLVELLRSYRVLESVVVKLRMHVWAEDSVVGRAAFARLMTAPDVRGGRFRIEILPGGNDYRLYREGSEQPISRGSLPDSIGREIGLRWLLNRGDLPVGPHGFWAMPPRDVAQSLGYRIMTSLPENGQILTVRISDQSPQRAAQTLNAVVDEFLVVARTLQQTQSGEYSVALREQLSLAESRLRAAEQSLESVRSANITQPSVGNGGSADPMVGDYFSKRLQLENLRRERRSLEQQLQSGSAVSVEALQAIGSVSPANGALGRALEELARKETQLRTAREQYSDEYSIVSDLVSQVATLRRETIPRLAWSRLEEMKLAERELDATVSAFTGELRKTPQRALDETRAKRDFDVADQFYTSLLSRWNEVRLASEGSTEELKVIDRAVSPTTPTTNSKRVVFGIGVIAGIALASLLVLLTDLLDGRLRYPEEVAKDLRLQLIARVPMLPQHVKHDTEMLVAAQAVEAFRAVRLRLQQSFEGRGRIVVVVTSEGVDEGKSLLSANLAMAFAESGARTLLVDGDLRRGSQHRTYGVPLAPGFADVLTGRATLQESIRATQTTDLSILTSGLRSGRVPELLDREKLSRMLQVLKNEFEVIIIDSAPLGAGVDTYALGAAVGNMLMVVRHGVTNRKALDGRLVAIDQLPIRIIGAVLNGVPSTKAFASYDAYSYFDDYALVSGDALQPLLPKPKG
jgi:succinoglycan biosynthesis transport protein ExoP